MKVCPVCGEVYPARAVRCHAHDVALRAWDDTATDVRLETVTDVERRRATDTPFDVRRAEPSQPWPTPDRAEPALADTPRSQSGEAAVVRAPARGHLLGERYRLSRQLGIGGYGVVFAAEDLVKRERVAIKVLTPAAAQRTEMITRFHREAIAASRARHPHIVDVADFDVADDGSHYIVMEYLDGSDLAEVLAEARRLPPARALVIAAQCARGLAAAHRMGVLHRDLKPANVFLVRRPDGGEAVKIIDFGISKLTRAAGDYTDVTSVSKVVGTPCYMSPEQARGLPLDARSDVYSLGVLLFEMLVGERPFTGRSPIEILAKHVDAPRVSPSAFRPELAGCPGLDALVLRALAPSPANRFSSMEELGAAIVECLRAIDPVAAERASEITGELTDPDEEAGPPRGRGRRAAAPVAAGLAAVAVAVLVLFAWPRGRRDEAEHAGRPSRTGSAPARAVTVPVPVPVAMPAAPSPAIVRITSTPAGATVRRDGAVIGATPLDLVLERADAPPSLTIEAPGYRDRRIVVDGSEDAVEVVLEPVRRRARPRRTARPAPSGAARMGVEEW